jgi:hypothetical protein
MRGDVVLEDARKRVKSGIAHIAAAVVYTDALRTETPPARTVLASHARPAAVSMAMPSSVARRLRNLRGTVLWNGTADQTPPILGHPAARRWRSVARFRDSGCAHGPMRRTPATAWRTLQLPDIAALRARLFPEWPIYALLSDRASPSALAGRIDAIAYEGDHTEAVIDWKSDIDPDETDMRRHARQLEDYLRATGTVRGALVYMTLGVVRWITVGALGEGTVSTKPRW